MNKKWLLIVGGVVAIGLIASIVVMGSRRTADKATIVIPSVNPTVFFEPTPTPSALAVANHKSLKAQDISGVASDFQFQAEVPASWEAAAVAANESLVLYDPSASGASPLDKAQIFIRSFRADSFLTLSTVVIHNRTEQIYGGRSAVRYEIEKKSGVANFSNQPTWRNNRHIVTDIRVSDENPSVFYVIAKRPDLDESVYQQFLTSLKVATPSVVLISPVDNFTARITKKTFGQHITPQSSPVQPERFSGYHTGVDVEYADVTEDVTVRAIADGVVLRATTASGYGGLLVLRHTIGEASRVVIYGHVDAARLPRANATVKAGEVIAYLGKDKSSETDGERKHLHFAILKTDAIDLRGYVASQAELTNWLNPLDYY